MKPMQELDLGDVGLLRIHVRDEERFLSPHTGRELRRQAGEATTPEAGHAVILEALKASHIPSVDPEGNRTALWGVRVPQYRLQNGSCHFTLELAEVEDLPLPDQVVLGEDAAFTLTPYAYREESAAGNGIQINLKTSLASDETERLFSFRLTVGRAEEYFPVTRRGISDETRRMRFGWGRWSRHDGEDKVEVILVEDRVDESDPRVKRGLGDGFADSRARREIALGIGYRVALLDLLEEKGVFSKEEREALNERAHDLAYRRYFDFSRVDDLDEEEF
jgi:hypothetical protein